MRSSREADSIPFFEFGGFGSDHSDRSELLRAALNRGVERSGTRAERARVVVIGDTPHDVAAAHAIGARCIAVSTGGYDAAALLAAGAGLVAKDLRAPTVLAAFD